MAEAFEPVAEAFEPAAEAFECRGRWRRLEHRGVRARGVAALALALVACEPAPPVALSSTTPRSSAPPASAARGPRDAGVAAPGGAPPADAPGAVTVTVSDECGLLLDQVYFEHGAAGLRDGQRPILDATADMFRCFLRTGEITKWQVIGHADDTEREPAALSIARARAVADALIARGVAAATLDVTGAGATQPQDRRRTPAARARNRRVFFLELQRRGASP